MSHYNILSDYEKQRKLRERDNERLYRSERTPAGIARKLETHDIFMTSTGVWKVLVRYGKNREFSAPKKIFIIYPRASRFLEVVCIDDINLSNKRPRDLAIFNAIDEYSQLLVAISFINHRVNRYDVLSLLEQVKANYGRLLKIVRLDNAKAHISLKVKEYCKENNLTLQFIDPGTPQQNWPVESFNGVIRKDLVNTHLWKWDNLSDKQNLLNDYRDYYNNRKALDSDPLKRTPNEIATAVTSKLTQKRLKFKLLRKHHGQVAGQTSYIQ